MYMQIRRKRSTFGSFKLELSSMGRLSLLTNVRQMVTNGCWILPTREKFWAGVKETKFLSSPGQGHRANVSTKTYKSLYFTDILDMTYHKNLLRVIAWCYAFFFFLKYSISFEKEDISISLSVIQYIATSKLVVDIWVYQSYCPISKTCIFTVLLCYWKGTSNLARTNRFYHCFVESDKYVHSC